MGEEANMGQSFYGIVVVALAVLGGSALAAVLYLV